MQQLTQQLRSGQMEIVEVPCPVLNKGQILVRNHYSLISAGTEGKTVSDARKGYIAKARSRQKEVKMVLEMVKNQGIKATYDLVMNKLEAPSPLAIAVQEKSLQLLKIFLTLNRETLLHAADREHTMLILWLFTGIFV